MDFRRAEWMGVYVAAVGGEGADGFDVPPAGADVHQMVADYHLGRNRVALVA